MISPKVFSFIFFALLLFPLSSWANGEAEKAQHEKHIYTVIEFEATFMNRKKEKVLKTLGEPDLRWELNGKEVWKYHQIIKDQGKLWNQNVLFDFGRVNHMWGDSSNEGKQGK